MTNPNAERDEAAEHWLIQRFPDYINDRSVLPIDIEVFAAGADWATAKAAERVVCLGAGNVLVQCSEVSTEANGPQVQVDFFKHSKSHEIGEKSTTSECDIENDWEHLACVGSNSVAALYVVIDTFTEARDKLTRARSLLGGEGGKE